jgi:NHLM bacteriocin system ABC transporter peptidase/ATP-binding protein
MSQGLALGARDFKRRRTPTVLQIESVECGAAALAMVLAAHGKWLPLTELRRLCGVSRDGSRASNMLRAARGLGLEAKGFRVATARIGLAPVPAIVFVNANHYMVLEGLREGRVHLNDPAGGPLDLSMEEFDRIFSGIVLCFAPGPGFTRSGAPPALLRPLLDWLSGAGPALAFVVFCGLALVVPGILIPAFSRIFIDQYIIDRQADWFEWLLAALVTVVALQVLLLALRDHCDLALRNRVAILSMTSVVRRLLHMPLTYFAQRSPGSVSGRAELGRQLTEHATEQLPAMVVGAGSMLFFAAVMLFYSLPLTLIAIAVTGLIAALNAALLKRLREGERRAALDQVKLAAKTIQGLTQIETLKASGTEDTFFETWAGHHAKAVNQQQKLGWTEANLTTLPEFCRMSGQAAVLMIGGLLIIEGSITIGVLVAFQQLHFNFETSSRALFDAVLDLQKARGTLDQLDDILDQQPANEFDLDRPPVDPQAQVTVLGRLRKLDGAVVVRNLRFGYSRLERPLIESISLTLTPGSRVALVGGSGSGKSTVGKLICGLIEPWEGEVLIDGRPLAAIPRLLLRNSVAVVDQDIAMFEGTVRENITLWDATMPDDRVVRAAKDAMIHDDIVRRVGSYAATVGEQGRNFSGGQKQRIEIARALVGDPSVLILDEATSALDPLVEKAFMDNVRRRGCTCIIIAHRLSTIRDCDEIIVMDRGAIVQRGAHEALIARDGPYRRLIEN